MLLNAMQRTIIKILKYTNRQKPSGRDSERIRPRLSSGTNVDKCATVTTVSSAMIAGGGDIENTCAVESIKNT